MKRFGILVSALAMVVVVLVPAVSAVPATHTDYEFTSVNFPLADPFSTDPVYVTPRGKSGWFSVDALPIGGNYVATDIGAAWFEETVYGKISSDFGTGNFHGPMTLTAPGEDGVHCAGRFNAQRKDFVETGKWTLHCDDGTTRRATWSFEVLTDDDGGLVAPWFVTGSGTSLSPQG